MYARGGARSPATSSSPPAPRRSEASVAADGSPAQALSPRGRGRHHRLGPPCTAAVGLPRAPPVSTDAPSRTVAWLSRGAPPSRRHAGHPGRRHGWKAGGQDVAWQRQAVESSNSPGPTQGHVQIIELMRGSMLPEQLALASAPPSQAKGPVPVCTAPPLGRGKQDTGTSSKARHLRAETAGTKKEKKPKDSWARGRAASKVSRRTPPEGPRPGSVLAPSPGARCACHESSPRRAGSGQSAPDGQGGGSLEAGGRRAAGKPWGVGRRAGGASRPHMGLI